MSAHNRNYPKLPSCQSEPLALAEPNPVDALPTTTQGSLNGSGLFALNNIKGTVHIRP